MSTVGNHARHTTAMIKETLKKRRPWYYLAAGLFLLSIVTRQPLVLLASAFTFLIALIPELWFRLAMSHLLVRQRVDHQHLFFGEEVTLSISVENRKALPLPWLQVHDSITPPLEILKPEEKRFLAVQRDTLVSTWLLGAYQRVTRRYRMRCYARGFHVFGPVRLLCSDPFGWLERELYLPANETLLVYPLIAPIETLGLPSVFPMGDAIGARHLLEDPLWFAGIREYQRGDDPRRIDWKATARVGELRSKLYESTTERRLLVLLDTWSYTQELMGIDFELQEFCISTAASLATWGLDNGYMVGLQTNSSMVTAANTLSSEVNSDNAPDAEVALKSNATTISTTGVSVPFALDYGQYESILTTLARLVPSHNAPIERIIELENSMFPQGTTIVLVSPINTFSENTLTGLLERRARGSAVNIVLVGDEEEGHTLPDTGNVPVYHIGGKEKWHELIRTVGDKHTGTIGTSSTQIQLD